MLVLDVPKDAAHHALTGGAIVFPAEPDSEVDDAATIGAIRLARDDNGSGGSSGSGGGTAPSTAPGGTVTRD